MAASLYCLLAARASRAVILRRGPSKQTCLIPWDRADDTFTPGQWVRRSSVYPERSDISADGEWLTIFLGRFVGSFSTWIVLSKPPFFTAVALWPKGDTWGGGGAFLGHTAIVLDHPDDHCDLAPGFNQPPGFDVYQRTPQLDARVAQYRAQTSRPWRPRPSSNAMFKEGPAGLELTVTRRKPSPERRWEQHFHLSMHGRDHALPRAQWADIDANGDIVFSIDGGLYRLPVGVAESLRAGDDIQAAARCLGNFTDLTFRCLLPMPDATGGWLHLLHASTQLPHRFGCCLHAL